MKTLNRPNIAHRKKKSYLKEKDRNKLIKKLESIEKREKEYTRKQ